ncbi:putative tRNA pseudouridine synthase-like 1 [Hypsibius exemplaris]|uniref:tRNA pseudouridine synthase n=1 Tax=Hypsibius exemplaris TaxID=2072580 RepID=A0A9X6RM04_HYPEX|nr:putative tRNA pseudouridine synthase-like 1 [Hypsibius exemplaris]
MVRYLLFFSYIGTKFNGAQAQAAIDVRNPRVRTVQCALEAGLLTLKPKNEPRTSLSSRTDSGVHAFESTAHVDLHHFEHGKFYKPDVITFAMNVYFADRDCDVRILRTRIVPDEFNCRHNATSRTYVYRIAVPKRDILPGLPDMSLRSKYISLLPLLEMNSCNLVYPPFDAEAAGKAARLFRGTHNFTSFMMKRSSRDRNPPRNPVRNMEVAEMTPGRGILVEHDQFHDHLEYWDFTFRSSGFLHRQVRRMVGALCAVGSGRLTEENITYMLDNPSHLSWMKFNPGHTPPQGLFLKKVTYNEKDMTLPADYFEVIAKYPHATYLNQKRNVFTGFFEVLRQRAKQLSPDPASQP